MQKVLLPVDGDPTITIAFSFNTGSQDDPPGKQGLASLTASMLVEAATKTRSYEAILEQLYPLATDYAATIDKELTTIDGRVHRDKLDDFVDLLLDALLNPAFREDDFERLRSDAINYIDSDLRYASDEELGKAALCSAVFADSPYAHPVEGTVAGLQAITLQDISDFYRNYYVRSRLTLAVGGGFDNALCARLEQALGQLPAGQPAAAPEVTPAAAGGRRVVLIDKPDADASISIGFPISARRGERDFYALAVANSWLGEHRHGASHLFQVIRETRGLNYGDYSYIEAFPDAGSLQMPPVNVPRRQQLFEIWIRTLPNDQAVFAIRCALRELELLIENGMTAEQFELTRQFLINYSTHYAPTSEARLGYAIDDRFYGIDGDGHLERFRQTLRELTLAEVNAAIRQHLQTTDLTLAIVTGTPSGLAASLASPDATPMDYPNPMPDAVLNEDREIAGWPLRIAADAIETIAVADLF